LRNPSRSYIGRPRKFPLFMRGLHACLLREGAIAWRHDHVAQLAALVALVSCATLGCGANENAATNEVNVPAAATPNSQRAGEAVAIGREVLSARRIPWYDATSDEVRPIRIRRSISWSLWDYLPRFRGRFDSRWIKWTMWGLLILALALVGWWALWAWRGRKSPAEETSVETTSLSDLVIGSETLPSDVSTGAANLLEQARQHRLAGNFRLAMICLFCHQLLELDRRQYIRLARGKTNRQYLRELAPRPQLSELLAGNMRTFEDVFFGNRSLEQQQLDRCWQRFDDFDRLLAVGSPAL